VIDLDTFWWRSALRHDSLHFFSLVARTDCAIVCIYFFLQMFIPSSAVVWSLLPYSYHHELGRSRVIPFVSLSISLLCLGVQTESKTHEPHTKNKTRKPFISFHFNLWIMEAHNEIAEYRIKYNYAHTQNITNTKVGNLDSGNQKDHSVIGENKRQKCGGSGPTSPPITPKFHPPKTVTSIRPRPIVSCATIL